MTARLRAYLQEPVSIAPLATFRVLFGGIMCVSVLRFILNGWVEELYIRPTYHFGYWGMEWVKPLGPAGMHMVFALMALAALGVAAGAFYRVSAALFFVLFTYTELLDKSNYLNHYYFVSIVAFLLIWVPAHGRFSVDVLRDPSQRRDLVPRWCIGAFRLQLGMVYWFAGFAKLNADWLLAAQPLRIWLPAKSHLPVLGPLLGLKATAYVFAWAGALYDLTVPFLLCHRRSRPLAYAAVIGFHVMTWWLFQIGMFPFIMILSTLIFFPAALHERVLGIFERGSTAPAAPRMARSSSPALPLLAAFFVFQALFPFRYLLYPGHLFWTEQGFRFSWRVMLMEKAGHATFRVRDPRTGGEGEVINSRYLSPNQEKMMATQPDMILQFAHHIAEEHRKAGIPAPEVYADVFVSLNGRGSRRFIDPEVDLSKIQEGWGHKAWILPFEEPQLATR